MKAKLIMDGTTAAGGTAILMHNERLSDPLDPYAIALSEIAKKRGKTEQDHREMARREFMGGLYVNGNGPCLPAWNILRCLQDGAKRHKRGKDVLRGVFPLTEHADMLYDGPRDPVELWQSGGFFLRKGVGVNRQRVIRTRPMFTEWRCELLVEVDPKVFDLHDLRIAWEEAGTYYGIGDGRPIYGRFKGTLESVAD